MTYGWAILIIAVVMVALFSLGVLGGNPLGTTCLAQSGFTCQNPVLHGTAFTVTIGQATGTSWTAYNVIWVPSGLTLGTAALPYANCAVAGSVGGEQANSISNAIICGNTGGALSSGGSTQVTFNQGVAMTTGTSASGQLWVWYQTAAGGSTVYDVQMTSGVNLKST